MGSSEAVEATIYCRSRAPVPELNSTESLMLPSLKGEDSHFTEPNLSRFMRFRIYTLSEGEHCQPGSFDISDRVNVTIVVCPAFRAGPFTNIRRHFSMVKPQQLQRYEDGKN